MKLKSKNELIYADECYKIMGLAFEIFNALGYGHKEIIYQKALAEIFRRNNLDFEEQLRVKLKYGDKELGIYIFYFLVFGKIVIEIKQRNYFSKNDIKQLYAYLRAKKLKLGLLIHFTKSGVRYKRIINLQ